MFITYQVLLKTSKLKREVKCFSISAGWKKMNYFNRRWNENKFEEKIIIELFELRGLTALTQNGFHNRGTDPALGMKVA
jgi:hypothetical protein